MVIDLDGVIADASHRQHFLDAPRSADTRAEGAADKKDWDGFFYACVDDPVIAAGAALAHSLSADVCVVILTARIDEIRQQTVSWLAANQIRHDWLILRGHRQGAPSTEWKRGQLELLAAAGAVVDLAIDDDPRNIAMVQDLGLVAMYVPSGYYDGRMFDIDIR